MHNIFTRETHAEKTGDEMTGEDRCCAVPDYAQWSLRHFDCRILDPAVCIY